MAIPSVAPSLVLIFAYAGVEVALAPSGEVRNPAHTVPRAIFLALAVTTTLYVAIQLVAQGVLGTQLAQETAAPLADAAARFLGGAGATLMLAGAVCSMFGYQCGDMLSTPRSLYALARDGFAPAILAYIHPQHRTPSVAIWTHATLALALAGTQTFQVLAIISNVGLLLLYLLACGAALELARRDVRTAGTPFRIPGARAAPFLAAGLIVWVLSTATVKEFAVTGRRARPRHPCLYGAKPRTITGRLTSFTNDGFTGFADWDSCGASRSQRCSRPHSARPVARVSRSGSPRCNSASL